MKLRLCQDCVTELFIYNVFRYVYFEMNNEWTDTKTNSLRLSIQENITKTKHMKEYHIHPYAHLAEQMTDKSSFSGRFIGWLIIITLCVKSWL